MSGKVVYNIILEIKIKSELFSSYFNESIEKLVKEEEIHITKALYFLESTIFNYILFFN